MHECCQLSTTHTGVFCVCVTTRPGLICSVLVYNTAMYCVVVYAVPLIIVGVFNLRLVATLAEARRNWLSLNSSQKRELRATRLPVVIDAEPFPVT